MKILFCSPCPLDRKLGAAKTLLELAGELETLGWQCDLVDPARVGADPALVGTDASRYPDKLHRYLEAHAERYDVVEFDYKRLALERRRFSPRVLMVARCQLLQHHFLNVTIPPAPDLRARLRALLLDGRDRARRQARVRRYNATFAQADLVVVANDRDRHEISRHGIADAKIHVIPFGLSQAQHRALEAVPVAPPEGAVVAFIGMYGPRKGAADFPDLVRRVAGAVPQARFRLLGTRGRYKTEQQVKALFPRALRERVEVIPSFAPESLPALLAPCAVGVFPSYVEGFGYGVLEMLAAALPVVAYDAPGPPVMLPPAYLVPPGDTAAMSRAVIRLLQDRAALAEARRWARARAGVFHWPRLARQLASTYEEALARLHA